MHVYNIEVARPEWKYSTAFNETKHWNKAYSKNSSVILGVTMASYNLLRIDCGRVEVADRKVNYRKTGLFLAEPQNRYRM